MRRRSGIVYTSSSHNGIGYKIGCHGGDVIPEVDSVNIACAENTVETCGIYPFIKRLISYTT